MAEGLSTAAANAALDLHGSTYTWIKLHVGAPGAAGTANAATETTRKQATWSSASGASKTTSAVLEWTNVAGAEDYTHWTAWTASTAGSFGFSGTITANAVAIGDTFTIPAGGLTITQPVAS